MSLNYSFKSKTILITGGGQGIGRTLCDIFYKGGATVFTLDKNPETIEKLRQDLPEIKAEVVDLADWDGTKKAIESFGPIDLLVNNAGVIIMQPLLHVTKEAAITHFEVNVLGPLKVSQCVAENMISRGVGGSIVNVSSMASKLSSPFASMYGASKAALESLTKSMAVELGEHNIRVNAIVPGLVDAPMGKLHPNVMEILAPRMIIKRRIETSEISDLIMFLLSPLASMINGETVVIDGGYLAT